MKPINSYIFFLSSMLFLLSSCSSDPKKDFESKNKIALCQQNKGMVTYDVYLYDDSTFYQPGDGMPIFSSGIYYYKDCVFKFQTLKGEANLCKEYKLDSLGRELYPLGQCSEQSLQFYCLDKNGIVTKQNTFIKNNE